MTYHLSYYSIKYSFCKTPMETPNRLGNILNETQLTKRYRVNAIWRCSSIGLGTEFVGCLVMYEPTVFKIKQCFSCYTQPWFKVFVIPTLIALSPQYFWLDRFTLATLSFFFIWDHCCRANGYTQYKIRSFVRNKFVLILNILSK